MKNIIKIIREPLIKVFKDNEKPYKEFFEGMDVLLERLDLDFAEILGLLDICKNDILEKLREEEEEK